MRRINKMFRSTALRLQQRGSALLASLMVIVGLSLLGLAFVAISETESAISVNERNHTQTVALAEAGARLVVQWFQDPVRMRNLTLMPANTTTFKTQRHPILSIGTYYKPDLATLLCDLPFGPLDDDKFFGAEDSADIIIDRTTASGRTFLDDLNDKTLGAEGTVDARPAGEITQIRLFAPPIVGATFTTAPTVPPTHFFVGGTRYGVATIMARAEKFDRPRSDANRRSIALAECRIVVSQFPMPTPAGPLQSASTLLTQGDFRVHWGLVSGQTGLDLAKDYVTLPWFNAYERLHIRRGYDSSVEWTTNKVYRVGDIVRPKAATLATFPLLRPHEYTVTAVGPPGNSGPNEPGSGGAPAWPTATDATITVNGMTYRERTTTAYPLTTGGGANQTNTPWLYYIGRGNVTVDDPWFHARTTQNDAAAPNSLPQPFPFPYAAPATYGKTHHFQFQSFDQYPDYKQLIFPVMNYDFWKAAAVAGNGQGGVKYLRWAGADMYTDGVTTQTFRAWASSRLGFYFFETQNNQNPQSGGPGILAPEVQVNGLGAYMGSFIYLNAPFATTGLSGPLGNFNQPGEPYEDVGYRQVNVASPTGDFARDAALMPIIDGAANRQWDYQDLPWSNTGAIGGGVSNGRFDVYVASRTVHDPSDTVNPNSTYVGWFPVPYRPGCFPGNNVDCPACNCSEPHEPYLNIKYSGAALNLQSGWFDPATAVATMRRPKKTIDGSRTGAPIVCGAGSSPADCTSNAYDLDGGLARLEEPPGGDGPSTDGVMYVEGNWTSKGNAHYYGAVLVGGIVDAKGTPNLWYDESLSRGVRLPGFPRVMVTSVETDR
jgi:hypothetical protein